jgi:hypothetical protein
MSRIFYFPGQVFIFIDIVYINDRNHIENCQYAILPFGHHISYLNAQIGLNCPSNIFRLTDRVHQNAGRFGITDQVNRDMGILEKLRGFSDGGHFQVSFLFYMSFKSAHDYGLWNYRKILPGCQL